MEELVVEFGGSTQSSLKDKNHKKVLLVSLWDHLSKPHPPGPNEQADLNEDDSSQELEEQHDAHGGGVDGGVLLHPGIVLHADAHD